MSVRVRTACAAVAAALLFAFALWGFRGLPPYGHYRGPYGTVLDRVAPHERKIPNVVTAVNFDYRAVDTLGEEFIFFAAVAGLALVLRTDRRKTTPEPLPSPEGYVQAKRTDAVAAFSALAIAVTGGFGGYLALHPHLSPGGGFQGGALLAGGAALLFLGLGYRAFSALVVEDPLQLIEALGAGAYAAMGIATLVIAGAFLANVLPLGREGDFFSTGTIPVINFFVGLEVCAGFVLLFLEFAHETRVEKDEKA